MTLNQKITSLHLDVLKEIGNIGAAHAATALSNLLGKKIDMRVPKVEMVSFNDMMELAGGSENVVVGIFYASREMLKEACFSYFRLNKQIALSVV